MDTTDIQLPAIRQDVTVVQTGHPRFPWALVCEQLDTQLGLDPIGRIVVEALSEPRGALEVLGIAHAQGEDRLDPRLLRRHVMHLAKNGFLEGARAEAARSSLKWSAEVGAELASMPLRYEPGLRHACQACGSCCSATDVGPIPDAVAETILAHDWTGEVDGLEKNEDVFRFGNHGGQNVRLMQMRNDQCVFLDDDKLCVIHKTIGFDKKPTPCRQFPYVFADQGGEVTVSLSMECRAYWRAKQAAPPTESAELDLRELLKTGAPVHQLPAVVFVDAGLVVDRAAYLAFETAVRAAVRADDGDESVMAPLARYGQAVNAGLTELYADVMLDETYCDAQRWSAVFGTATPEPDAWEQFLAQLGKFTTQAVEFTAEGRDVAAERKLPWLSQRFEVLRRAFEVAGGSLDASSFRFKDPAATAEILQDVIVSALFSKEIVRRSSLRAGLGLVGLRALLTLSGACDRAKQACRVEVTVQDVIDSMVTISKVTREAAILDFLSGLETSLFTLFATNLGTFAQHAPPRLHGPGVHA